MGRPLNKKYFGNPAQAGFQITCSAWFVGQGSPTAGVWITKQSGSNKYHVTNGTLSGIMRLVQGAPAAAGQMQVTVQPTGTTPFLDAADEADFDGVGGNGTFTGGEDYSIADEITLSNGAVITVGAVDGGTGEVTEFTVTSVGNSVTAGTVLTQTSVDPAGGTGFSLTVGNDNINNVPAPAESASRIKNRVVKTFEGNIYNWPTTGGGVERVLADISGS